MTRSGNQAWKGAFSGVFPALGMVWRAGPIWATAIVTLTVLSAVTPVVGAWLTKLSLDRLAGNGPLSAVLPLAVALAAVGLAASAVPVATRYIDGELERRISLLAQDRLYSSVGRLPGLAKFEDPVFLDRLRLAAQSGGVTPGQVSEAAMGLVAAVIMIAGFLGSLLALNPLMAAVVLFGALPALGAEVVLSRRRAAMIWRLGPVERREFFYSQLLTSTEAAKEVRLFGLGSFLHHRMLQERRTANAEKRRMDRQESVTQLGLGALSAGVSGIGLIWAISQARRGTLSVGDVSMFIAAVAGVQGSLTSLVGQIGNAHRHLLVFDHYQSVVNSEPDLPVRSEGKLPALRRGIEFRDVWFQYGPDHPWVLRGLNLTIPHGASVGLVGLNGSGKSTVVKLLCRFYDPVKGTILWDGVDLRDVPPDVLRDRMAAVFQDYTQYDLTAGENIGLGDLQRFDDRPAIQAAARKAGAHDLVVALSRGYDTPITRFFLQGEEEWEGVFLSGGQGQRIAIARAMVRDDRDLLILDEPSSGLDAEAEHEIHMRLKTYRKGRTSLLISHRLGAVRDADLLVVLDEGLIVESGSHAELMEIGGAYARLFTIQSAGYREHT